MAPLKWFHRHRFDPEKWKHHMRVNIHDEESKLLFGHEDTFINYCLDCGDIVFRKVRM